MAFLRPSTTRFRLMAQATLAFVATGAIALVAQVPAQAQAVGENSYEGFPTNDDSTNPFEASGDSGIQSGMYDLIHRMMLSNGTSMEEFSRQRQENISDQAQSFREMQLQQIQLQQQQQADDIDLEGATVE